MIEQVRQQTGRERVSGVLFYGTVLLLAWLVFRIYEPFLVPLGWATVLVVVFHPWHARLEARFGAARAALLSTTAITLILVLPALLLMTTFISEGMEAGRNLQQSLAQGQGPLVERARTWVVQRYPAAGAVDFAALAQQAAERLASFLAARATGWVRDVLTFFMDLFITLFALFFLFRDRRLILDTARRLVPFSSAQREQMFAEAGSLIQASVTASLIIALIQGVVGGLTFALLGISGVIFWGVTMGVFALIPLLGKVVVAPVVLWLLVTGQVTRAIILAVIGFGVIFALDNFARPFLAGGRAQMSTLTMFISVLGGISVFGILGLVLGPIVVAMATSVLDVYTEATGTAPAVRASAPAPDSA